MARRQERSRLREFTGKYADELAYLTSGWGATQLPFYYQEFVGDVRGAYRKNIRKARDILPPPRSPQRTFRGILSGQKRKFTKKEAERLRTLVQNKFYRKIKRSTYKYGRGLVRDFKALKPSAYHPSLTKANRRSLLKIALRTGKRSIPALALTFGSIPLASAIQARYAPGRKFKKEFKRGVKRGVVSPVYGATVGIPLAEVLDKRPYLRRVPSIRALEGKLAQKYGQGIEFYKGSSGFSREDRKKLERSLKAYRKLRNVKKKKKR